MDAWGMPASCTGARVTMSTAVIDNADISEQSKNLGMAEDDLAVREITRRVDNARESATFYKIVALVAAGMLMDSIDVYVGSAVASSALSTGWSTVAQNSLFLSAGFLGLLVGSLLAGFIGDLRGRKTAYQINLLLFGGFTLLGALAPNMAILSVCRLGAGLGLGAEIVTGFSMVNEFAPIKHRGRWSAIVSLVANTGVPLAMLLCAWIIPRWSWRPLFVGIGLAAALIWYLRRDIPESPRWLALHGRMDEAIQVVELLEADNGRGGSSSDSASGSARAGREGVEASAKASGSVVRGLIVATVAVSATNVCSYAFTSWVPTILLKRGINLSGSLWISTLMMLGAPLGCLIGSLLLDRIGRKRIIVTAFLLTAVFGLLYAAQTSQVTAILVGILLMASLYVLMSSVVAVYAPELFPTTVRFRCVGIANAVAKLCNVLMPVLIGAMLSAWGSTSIFVTISLVALASMLVVGLMGWETSGRSVG